MSPSSSGRETPANLGTPGRHTNSTPQIQPQSAIVNTSDSTTETPKRSEDSASTSVGSQIDANVQRQTSQPEYHPDTWHNEEQRGRATPQPDTSRTSRLFGNRGHVPLSSDAPAEEKPPVTKRLSARPENGEYSPPWTGKDSAYSSVSGASAMSPGIASTRSASSMSSRQTAQFGLFPSRNLSTPKGSISGRLGAGSPAFDQPDQFFKPDMPNRPATSMSNFSDVSPKRLSKRSSFSSLKRLFSKKRTGDIDAIAE